MSSDALKRAEEALAKHQKAFGWHEEDGCKCAPCALSRLLAAEPATERETRLEAAYQREHARLTEVLGALSEVLPPGAEIRPALLALKARAEAAEPAKGADMSRAEGALAAEVRAALNVANGRWYEWGERAESVEEILLAGLRGYERAATAEPAPPAGAEVARLTALLRECNAVCLCGCPDSEHESYGEDGESCGDEEHECIRVAPAVLEIVQRYRVALSDALAQKPAGAEVREAAEAQFGRALLPLWWDDGNPGDIDGSAAQDAAEASGLWRRVKRHADGVECEWCNNEEPCGELTEIGRSALRSDGR